MAKYQIRDRNIGDKFYRGGKRKENEQKELCDYQG